MEPRDLSAHERYEAGRGIEEVARELGRDPSEFVKLASNENPHGPSPAAVEAVRDGAQEVHRYPTATHADLRGALADRWDVDPAQVWLSPGADGALDYLARAMLEPDDAVLVPDPGFAYYSMSARYAHGRTRTYTVEGPEFEQTAATVLSAYDGERMVYLTAPHSPTGAPFTPSAVERVAAETDPDTLVVADEAYGEYTAAPSLATAVGGAARSRPFPDPTAVEAAPDPVETDRDDIAVLRTFSKAYGLAGLRAGYALVPESWADAYAAINTPFATNDLACRGALAALDDDDHVDRSVESAVWAREYLRTELSVPVRESEANFVLAEVGNAAAVADRAKERGVIVRDCTSFGLPGHLRVSCGTREETRRAASVLNEVFETVGVDVGDRPEVDA
jgi:histidinol-phosphate aminotransferase